ncbi:hypothetical protein AVEN_16912-1 [Araneus ventricosus]|uniref:Uncharacterized protein n=1 Tax=Araneus ventricosus TaxID=182803 RepID=A0A4Y2J913_ARAVE|nr:hypothetical protein AVEN_16912-1 [Araneus ventricosus]
MSRSTFQSSELNICGDILSKEPRDRILPSIIYLKMATVLEQGLPQIPFHSLTPKPAVTDRETSIQVGRISEACFAKTHSKLALQGGMALAVKANLWQITFASKGVDSASLVCHSFTSGFTHQICHDKIISSKNQTCCKSACYLGYNNL